MTFKDRFLRFTEFTLEIDKPRFNLHPLLYCTMMYSLSVLNFIHSGGKSPARIATELVINGFLSEMNEKIHILDIGAKKHVSRNLLNSSSYTTCDIIDHPTVDVICDAHNLPFDSEKFDLILCIEVLEHLKNPQKAIDEMFRVLKQDGEIIISTRFIFPFHPDPFDYYRFTVQSLEDLLIKFSDLKIKPAGGLPVSVAMLLLHALPKNLQKHRLFSWIGKLPVNQLTRFACGYVLKAKK